MRTSIFCLISLALICFTLNGATATTLTTNTVTTATFNSTPTVVMDGSSGNTTDTPWQDYSYATFGADTINTTLYLWGIELASTSVQTICRTLSATVIAYANDTTETSVTTGISDNTQSVTITAARSTTPVFNTGLGYLGIATVQSNSATAASVTMDSLVFYVVNPTSITPKTIATSATTTSASSTTTSYSFAVNWVWFEDYVFYILYEAQTSVVGTGTTITVSGTYIQGVFVNNTALYYSIPKAVTTSISLTSTTAGSLGVPLTYGIAQNSNYSNSTSTYVTYTDISGGFNLVKGAVLTRATGTISTSAATIATSTASTTYSVGGIITYNGSAGAYDWMVGNTTTAPTYGITAYYNGSTTASDLALTFSSPTSAPTGQGFVYSSGFGVIVKYATSATTNTYITQTYYNNGTVNNTLSNQSTIGTFASSTQVSSFIDVNGAFWFGYVIGDTTDGSPNQAWIGTLYGQVYPQSSSASNFVATLAILLSLVIMSLSMF